MGTRTNTDRLGGRLGGRLDDRLYQARIRDTFRGSMVLYLLTAVPLAYAFVLVLNGAPFPVRRFTVFPVVKGFVTGLVVYGILVLSAILVPLEISFFGVYIFSAVFTFTIPLLVAISAFFFLERRVFEESETAVFTSMTSFLAAFFSVYGLLDIVFGSARFSIYDVILVPSLRVGVLLLIPILVVTARSVFGWMKIVTFIALAIIPFGLPFISVFWYFVYPVETTLVVAIVTATGAFLFLFLRVRVLESYADHEKTGGAA